MAQIQKNKALLAESNAKDIVEQNILVATWINDIQTPQKESEPRRLFFMNESLLLQENIRNHFDQRNEKLFREAGQDFVCLKGSVPQSQDKIV